MPIYKKKTIEPYLNDLDEFYERLRAELTGSEPSRDIAQHYGQSPDNFSSHYTQVDIMKLKRAIAHFKVSVDCTQDLKSKDLQEKRIHTR